MNRGCTFITLDEGGKKGISNFLTFANLEEGGSNQIITLDGNV